MPKVILQVYPSLGNTEQMAAHRPIGRDNDAYQRTLEGLVELVQVAVVEVGLLVRFSFCVYGCCFEGGRLVVAFCAPGYVVGVAEGVDVDDVCVGWGEEEVLEGL